MAKRILIADDEPTVVALAKQKLEERGFAVETARNGREAMRIIDVMTVDLIVLDVIMPVMDGVDVYKEIKKSPRTANIPIVIMTDNKVFRESFHTLGVEHFIPKPIEIEKLLHKIEYIFACVDLGGKNKHVLILGTDPEINSDMGKVFEAQNLVVGKSQDPIDFIATCLILAPRLALVDILQKGDVSSEEVIRALRCFNRLADMKVLTFTSSSPEEIDSRDTIDRLGAAKSQCMSAGADRFIGRFSPDYFWDTVKDFVS